MKRIITIVITISIAILICCNKEKPGPKPVKQEIIKPDENKKANVTFSLAGKIPAAGIRYPSLAVSAAQDRIYVYGDYLDEPRKFIIRIYNRKLEYISQKIFFRGQGPGDVAELNVVTPIDDKLYIVGNSNQRVSIHDKNLDYIDCIKFNWGRVGGPFPLMENGRYFIGMQSDIAKKKFVNTFKLFSFPEMDGKAIFEHSMIAPVFNNGILVLDSMPCISYFFKDKSIYFLYMNDYRVLTYNLNGDRLRDVLVKVDRIEIPEDKKELYLKEYSRMDSDKLKVTFSDYVMPAGHIVPLNKGFIVVRRQDYSTECSGMTTGDYFNYGIEFIGKARIPCFYQVYLIVGYTYIGTYQYDEGFLYLLQEIDEELWLEKWRVEE